MAQFHLDLNKALLDPSSVFHSPEDVVRSEELSTTQKIQILHRWEYDAREIDVALEENMGSTQTDLLDKVLQALNKLGAITTHEHSAPTKQGGEEE